MLLQPWWPIMSVGLYRLSVAATISKLSHRHHPDGKNKLTNADIFLIYYTTNANLISLLSFQCIKPCLDLLLMHNEIKQNKWWLCLSFSFAQYSQVPFAHWSWPQTWRPTPIKCWCSWDWNRKRFEFGSGLRIK